MKTRIVYFSRTGHTRALAERLAHELKAEVSEIRCDRYRGVFGYWRAAYDSFKGRQPEIEVEPPIGPADWLVLGSPVWTSFLSAPMRRFVSKVAHLPAIAGVFVTRGGKGTLTELEEQVEALRPAVPPALLAVKTAEIGTEVETRKIEAFKDEIAEVRVTPAIRPAA